MQQNTSEEQTKSDGGEEVLPNKKLHRVDSLLKFGEQYKAAQIQQFSDYYIDYESLKALLHDQFTSEAHAHTSLRKKRNAFLQALLKEISGVDNFHAEHLRKYYEQHLKKLSPTSYNDWKMTQREKRQSFAKNQGGDADSPSGNSSEIKSMPTSNGTTKGTTPTTTTTAENDGISSLDIDEALMAINEDQVVDVVDTDVGKEKEQEPEKENPISSKDVTMASRALSGLLLFWKQNELAIFNIVKKYEAYSGESIQQYLKIGPQANTSHFTLPMLPKVASRPEEGSTVASSIASPLPALAEKEDPQEYQKKLKQDLQRVCHSIERYKKRRDTTEAELDKLNSLQTSLAEKTPMPVPELDLSKFFVQDPVATVSELPIEACEPGSITRFWLEILNDPLSSIKVPVIICKGNVKGPIMGITAALHGNEVNGVSVIHQLVRAINVEELTGVLVAVPVANPPGFIARSRYFSSGQDLNRLFPGQKTGYRGNQYAWYFADRFVRKITHLIDLHTASHGRQNSLYVRTDMTHSVCKQMALLQSPQIIVHNMTPDGSLREAALRLGKPAITVEIGNPSSFQKSYIIHALQGVENVLSHLGMIHEPVETPEVFPTICVHSRWYYAEHGGTLEMKTTINQWIKKGDAIAVIRNIFGDLVHQYVAQEDGVVIGRNVDPVCQSGDKLVNLGIVGKDFARRKGGNSEERGIGEEL